MKLELSAEKTLITRPEDGFVFLGYRVIRAPSLKSGVGVGKLRIPQDKLKSLRREIKKRTDRSTHWLSLKQLIRTLNPLITGWRTYFQFAAYACSDFAFMDHWLWRRIDRWLRRKYRRTAKRKLRARFRAGNTPALRWRWKGGTAILKCFNDGGTHRYHNRGTTISNGWNEAELGPLDWRASMAFWYGFRATMYIR